MFPNSSFPLYSSARSPDHNREQILLALLEIKSQQNRLTSLLSQQPLKLNLLAQPQMAPNPYQFALTPTNISTPQTIRPEMLVSNMERINPFTAQIQPSALDFQLLRRMAPTPFGEKIPFSTSTPDQRTEGSVPRSNSDFEPTQVPLETVLKTKAKVEEVIVKREELHAEEEEEEIASKASGALPNSPEKVSTSKKIRKIEKTVNTCGHPERKHYAKGLCNNCYHKFGRVGKPELCEHDVIYAKGLCQKCYLIKYNQQKTQMMKKKKKTKVSHKSK